MSSSRSVAPRRARPVLEQPTYKAPRYHSRLWSRLIFVLLILVLFGGSGALGALYWSIHRPQSSSSQQVPVQVSSGDGVASIADRLQRSGVIDNALLFRLDARLQNLGSKLKVGDYVLRRNMSIDQMIAALQVYHLRYVTFTIPEGFRMEQIAGVLQQQGIDRNQFVQEVRHPDLHLAILQDKPSKAGLEGYLFPNTYKVPPHDNGRDVAAFMVKTLGEVFTPAMRARARREGFSIFQVLTLASIVEREARVPSERPIIASVYLNRLRIHMILNADPTIQYAVGTPKRWWPVLTLDQLKIQSAYNTYIHGGLPPGPIANPGLASIQAVLYPTPTNYFYFVAKGQGRHAFEQTLAQHNADVARYQP